MNKTELVDAVARATARPKTEVGAVIDATVDTITKTLKKGDRVQLTGFGTFERRAYKASVRRNPQTGEPLKVKAGKRPAFKPGKTLKDAVNK
jgi:DNA-binding protein HU-beta